MACKNFALALLLLSSLPAFAARYAVSGEVVDSLGEPESFATIRIFLLPDTVKPAIANLTDDNGKFSITVPGSGDYKVNILSFGKADQNRLVSLTASKPEADLGKITMYPTDNVLNEVVVTAQKPLVSKEIDRIGYDVQADTDAQTSQLDEILKKVPLVSVDPDGTIKVKGSTDFKVYKNGRPNNSFSRNAKDIFKSLPASSIKKIEVITDPGAREDAEGTAAILNIVTMENTVMKGAMGNVGLNYSKDQDYPSPNIWMSAQLDKFNVSLYGGMGQWTDRMNRHHSESLTKYEDSGNELHSESKGNSHGKNVYYGIDMSLELDTLNLFTAEFGGYYYNNHINNYTHTWMNSADGSPVYSYSSRDVTSPDTYLDFNGSFNYQRSTRRKGEHITLSYRVSTTDQRRHAISDYENEIDMPVPYLGIDNEFHLNFLEQTAQADWTHPINQHNKFDVGAKYINRRNHSINDIDYLDYQQTHSNFTHLTQVMALYYDYRLNYDKWGARAGLRYEYSHLSARYKDGSNAPFGSDLSDWVPNASVSYNINDGNTLKLSYSTRINRPGISQLNPAVVETPSSISSGNPDLGSSHTQSIGFNYNFIGRKLNFDFNASYAFSNNTVISVQQLIEGDIIRYGYANQGRTRNFNISLWGQWRITSKTSFMLNGGTYYAYSANKVLNISHGGWGAHGYCRLQQRLPFDINLSAYLSSYISSPGLYSTSTFSFADNAWYGLNIDKSFLKEKRLRVGVGITNPFGKHTRVYESTPRNTGYTGYNRYYTTGRSNSFNINISYRFGSMNVSVKKTDKSITNDDVESNKN